MAVPLLGSGIDLTGVSDSTSAVQALLTANPGRVFRGVSGSTYKFTGRLNLLSGQTFDMTGCTLNWVGATSEMLGNNASINPQRSVSNGAMTSGSATLTSATAAFTSADVGRAVTVLGAGPGGYGVNGNILTVTNSTTVTLDVSAQTTVTGATLRIYDRDRDITLIGGTYTRDATSTTKHGICFRRADRVKVFIGSITTLAGLYAVNLGHCADFDVSGFTIAGVRDGVHVNGPARDGRVSKIRGDVGDDLISFTGNDLDSPGGYYVDCIGDINYMTVQDVRRTEVTDGAIAGNSCVRILPGLGCKFRDFAVSDIHGGVPAEDYYVIRFEDYPLTSLVGCDASRMNFTGITGYAMPANLTRPLLMIGGAGLGTVAVSNMTIHDVPANDARQHAGVRISARATGATLNLVLSNIVQRSVNSGSLLYIESGATWKSIQGVNLRRHAGASGNAGGLVESYACSGPIQLANIHALGGTSAIYLGASSGTQVVNVQGFYVDTTTASGIKVDGAMTLRAILDGVDGESNTTNGFIHLSNADAAADVVWGSVRLSGLLTRSGSQAVRFNGAQAKVDISAIGSNDGDMVYNTNAALDCGAGLVLWKSGTGWKNLFTGSTQAPIPFVSDTFTGSAVAITAHTGETGATWTAVPGNTGTTALTLNGSGAVVASTSGAPASFWYASGAPGGADYSSTLDVTVATSNSDSETGPTIRQSTSARTCYELVPLNTTFALIRWVAGSATSIATVTPSGGVLNSVTYRLTLTGTGTTITGKVQRLSDNNYLTSGGTWQSGTANAISVTDSNITAAGRPGIGSGGTSAMNGLTVDNFSATA